MAGGKKGADTSKRAAGMAKKAEVAAQKAAAEAAQLEAAEQQKWQTGAKANAKREVEAAKKAELARKKAEREALLAEEEASTPGRSTPKKSKAAVKKTRGLDLSALDDDGGKSGAKSLSALNASGIDNALDALSLTTAPSEAKVDKHPERRYPAAYAKFEERRLAEMESDGTGDGLRQNQKKERIKKEFEKHPDNPFNQLTAKYNASRAELDGIKRKEQDKIEKRLAFP